VTIDAWERAHALCVEAGDTEAAAGAAVRVAMHLLFDTAFVLHALAKDGEIRHQTKTGEVPWDREIPANRSRSNPVASRGSHRGSPYHGSALAGRTHRIAAAIELTRAGVGKIAQPGPCPLGWVRENGFGNVRVVLAVWIVLARGRNVTV
jgi:hypothetical protein